MVEYGRGWLEKQTKRKRREDQHSNDEETPYEEHMNSLRPILFSGPPIVQAPTPEPRRIYPTVPKYTEINNPQTSPKRPIPAERLSTHTTSSGKGKVKEYDVPRIPPARTPSPHPSTDDYATIPATNGTGLVYFS